MQIKYSPSPASDEDRPYELLEHTHPTCSLLSFLQGSSSKESAFSEFWFSSVRLQATVHVTVNNCIAYVDNSYRVSFLSVYSKRQILDHVILDCCSAIRWDAPLHLLFLSSALQTWNCVVHATRIAVRDLNPHIYLSHLWFTILWYAMLKCHPQHHHHHHHLIYL